jgi:hypothetical protein
MPIGISDKVVGGARLIGEAAYVHLLYEFSVVEKYDRTPETAQSHGAGADVP